MKILLTGFVPFGDVAVNPSQLIVEKIAASGRFPDLCAEILPVEFAVAGDSIRRLIRDFEPEAVVCVGVAQNRTAITLERVALNLDDARIPDNAGSSVKGRMIVPDGPVGYWSTLPLERMQATLAEKAIPVEFSNHAGAYLCNHVFFAARHELESTEKPIPCGFIHVPPLCETPSDDCAGLSLEVMVEAIEACLDCLSA
jgi:pyroglutamyl-peptidase